MKSSHFSFFVLFLFLLITINTTSAQDVTEKNYYPYIDVHMHPAIKPFNSRHTGNYNIWERIDNSCQGKLSKLFVNGSTGVPRYTQCNIKSSIQGNFRIGFLSLTPVEKSITQAKLLNEEKQSKSTMACVSGIALEKPILKDDSLNYYEDFVQNVDFVLEWDNKPYYINGVEYRYEVVKNLQHFEEIQKDNNRIALIFNIEGGHTLGKSLEPEDISQSEEYATFYLDNVDRIKGLKTIREGENRILEHPILSMNINHFFWNGLGGHARTFDNLGNFVFNQNKGMGSESTELGKKVIKKMLDKSQGGRRVLVDVKHMSWKARQWYYSYLEELRATGDNVPIISSHSTIAGISAKDERWLKKDNPAKNKKANLNLWRISLCDEDVQQIHQSKGIIGLMLDRYKLYGGKSLKEFKKTVDFSKEQSEHFIKIYWTNIFECIEAVNDKSAWDIIAIGSDYDGMVSPPNGYERHEDFPRFASDLKAFLDNPKPLFDNFTVEEIQQLMFGYSSDEIIKKIMYSNGLDFTTRALANIKN